VAGEPALGRVEVRGQRGQPQVQVAVVPGFVKYADLGRQGQHIGLPLAQHGVGAAARDALQQRARAAHAAGARRGNAHALAAAAGAEHEADGALHLLQPYRGVRGAAIGRARDEAVPLAADPFFHAALLRGCKNDSC